MLGLNQSTIPTMLTHSAQFPRKYHSRFIVASLRYLAATLLFLTASDSLVASPGDPISGILPTANDTVFCSFVDTEGRITISGNFSQAGGQTRNRIARFNVDGSIDLSFNPDVTVSVRGMALQSDGKILICGPFNQVGGQPRNHLARLHADGSLDTSFDPDANMDVTTVALQPDGKIVIGGLFTLVSGESHSHIARLNADGSPDGTFLASANNLVATLLVQNDGKILMAGSFTSAVGQSRNRLARLNPDGTLDAAFNPNVNDDVACLAMQADGKIIVGGIFSMVGGQTRTSIARLHPDGSLDTTFDAGGNGTVTSLGIQTDGKILLSGNFTTISAQAIERVCRLDANGVLDPTFTSSANAYAFNLILKADGTIFVGGAFSQTKGINRDRLAFLSNDPAFEDITVVNRSRLKWERAGSSPETSHVTFELSTDGGSSFLPLGNGSRIPGEWELTGLNLPMSGIIRARARTTGSLNGASGLVESQKNFILPPLPTLSAKGKTRLTTSEKTITLLGKSKNASRIDYKVGRVATRKTKGRVASWRIHVRLKPGRNHISVIATGHNGDLSQPLKFVVDRKN